MEVILFRHGEKQNQGADPELTLRGHAQAKMISSFVANGSLPKPTHIYTSPRKRAVQTLQPLSQISRLKVKTNPELDQQMAHENSKDFRLRIQEFLVKTALDWFDHDVIYLCSHHDWILEFLSVIDCDTDLLQSPYLHWESAQYMHFDRKDLWHLIKFGAAK